MIKIETKKNKICYEKNIVFLTTKKSKFRKKCYDEKKKKKFRCENKFVIKKNEKKIHHCDFTKF